MKQLLLTYLRPYRWRIGIISVLVLGQAIGNLYLPTLNADIINNGVAKGDTDVHPADRPHHARRCAASSSRARSLPRSMWRGPRWGSDAM